MPGTRFDHVADDYDAARPSYPDEFFEAIEEITGPLAGHLVLDGGAGTGIASRQQLLTAVASIVSQRFPDGQMTVPYCTRAWIARRR